MIGWIKLHRSLLDWEWYDNLPVRVLFIHLLMAVNYEDKTRKGLLIKRGQTVSGRRILAEQTGLTERQIRTALDVLQTTNELTVKKSNKGSLITIVNYDLYQSEESKRPTKSPTKRQRTTTTKESKENKNNKVLDLSLFDKDKIAIIESWIDYRVERKKKLTQSTVNSLAKILNENSVASCEFVINKSISNGWTGLFWDNIPKDNKDNGGFKLDLKNI